jgi:hypothetical protein
MKRTATEKGLNLSGRRKNRSTPALARLSGQKGLESPANAGGGLIHSTSGGGPGRQFNAVRALQGRGHLHHQMPAICASGKRTGRSKSKTPA